ncbi:MAG: hypothetical protein EOP50_05660 [Sphingobacteriales bacterium]|nr:MAG: hypothetical protein EOP50_05660 [Sphingobacteriales bacterium]
MKTLVLSLLCLLGALCGQSQSVARFEFHLYTDSLKRGFFNYINIDAQLSDSSWRPLDSTAVIFSSDAGPFRGNDLFVDSSFRCDSATVRAALRSNPKRFIETVIYIRKRPFGDLPTEEEVINGTKADKHRRKGQ